MNHLLNATRRPRLALAAGITAALTFGAFHTGWKQATGVTPSNPFPAATAVGTNSQVSIRRELGTFAKLAKDLKPAVVNIQVEKVVSNRGRESVLEQLYGDRPQFEQKTRGQGSGVIISADGYIMTNNHVVSGASTVKVTLQDGQEFAAHVVGTDPKTDVALVKVENSTALPFAELGDSDQLEVGDWVMAIGNPFGLDETVTVGVLSGKGRVIGAGPYDDFLQTDASINPGNSGGPLFNTDGKVVGVNTAIIPNGQGIGFSIPINLAKDIVDQLKTTGHVSRGFIGLGTQPLTPKLRDALNLPKELKGALISQVIPDGPAGRAGARVQDVVTSINDHPIQSDRELLATVARLKAGSTVKLVVMRGNSPQELSLQIAPRPDDQAAMPTNSPTGQRTEALGLDLQALSPEIAAELQTNDLHGIAIVGVAANSAAARAGLQTGDIVRKVNDRAVDSMDNFVSAVQEGKQKDSLVFLVERGGATRFLTIDS